MARLTTIKPKLKVIQTNRLKPVYGEQRRISGGARVSLKRRIWLRDGGHCCMCNALVDLCDSELDHRQALQFGGNNAESNLWTLCIECHRSKSAREASTGAPDDEAMSYQIDENPSSVTIV